MKIKHLTKIFAGSVAAIGLAMVVGSPSVDAAQTGTINLTGSVAQNCNITVTPDAGATLTSAQLTTSTASIQVGHVLETCNDPKGYTVKIASSNGSTSTTGILKGAVTTNTDTVTYSVAYGASSPGTNVTLTNGSGTAETTSAKTSAAGVTNNVFISTTGVANLAADTYTDTLTVTMTAN